MTPLLVAGFVLLLLLLGLINFNNKSHLRMLAIGALIMSMVLTGVGGLIDMTGGDRLYSISKQHAWNDGLYLVLASIALALL